MFCHIYVITTRFVVFQCHKSHFQSYNQLFLKSKIKNITSRLVFLKVRKRVKSILYMTLKSGNYICIQQVLVYLVHIYLILKLETLAGLGSTLFLCTTNTRSRGSINLSYPKFYVDGDNGVFLLFCVQADIIKINIIQS